MKKILSLVLVSALGGVLTLGAYKLFLEPEEKIVVSSQEAQPAFLSANNIVSNVFDTNNVSDFTVAAENTIHTVVHRMVYQTY